jgi:hypothetical protein
MPVRLVLTSCCAAISALARSQNHPSFQGGRHDQAILSALFYKLGYGLALVDKTWPADTAPIIAASRRRHD